jgi:hypothetical protein
MKKMATWYLTMLGALNLLLAQGTATAANTWTMAYEKSGVLLSNFIIFFLRFYWWPYLFFGFALLLAFASLRSRLSDNTFYHFIFGMFVAECLILFVSQFVFALPFASLLTLGAR